MAFSVRNGRLIDGRRPVEFVRSPSRGGPLDPKFLVIHYTASGPGFDTAAYFARAAAKVSAHLVVRRDGSVKQCVPFDVVGFHAGRSSHVSRDGRRFDGLNQSSIGIEIENWGSLARAGSGFVSFAGDAVDASRVIVARHKFGMPHGGWEAFTEAQVASAIGAAQAICASYGIEEIIGHDDISPGRKSDPGPAWNMASFRAKVLGRASDEAAHVVVRSPSGLNIRSGPSAAGSLVRATPLADGTAVTLHQAEGAWRFVSVVDAAGRPDFSGWVHGAFLSEP